MKKILLIAGTRPNFIKLAPLYHRLIKSGQYDIKVCHTGQHFDHAMSDVFWTLLQLPTPDFMLQCTGSTSAQIIGKTVIALDEVLQNNAFDMVIVFGDVNATVAGAIVSSHRRIKLLHVEAGLRSFDRDMPEEVNRVITDHISDALLVSEPSGLVNLKNEGIEDEKVFFVGNIMIESLVNTKSSWEKMDNSQWVSPDKKYVIATFHRPENVDIKENMQKIIRLLKALGKQYTIILPLHPRTKKRLTEFGLMDELLSIETVQLTDPLDYFVFLKLIAGAAAVLTDSGGVQEETTYLEVACVTLRKNTERPVTITEGTNLMASVNDEQLADKINAHIAHVLTGSRTPVKFWDNKVSERILSVIDTII